MEKQDIMDYVLKTPENTNPAILRGMLDQLEESSSGGGGESDFSIANVTALGDDIPAIEHPTIKTSEVGAPYDCSSTDVIRQSETGRLNKVVLYKGHCIVFLMMRH